jgi:ATP-dependent DNA helicase RecQ
MVRAALELLRRSGVLRDGGGVSRLQGAPTDFEAQADLREHAYARLNQVMGYARGGECRHARIADYFGEEGAPRSCASCDVCLSPRARRVVVGAEEVAAALGAVARFDGHLGASRLASLLRGADDAWAQQRPWVRDARFFGALRAWGAEQTRELLAELIESGCLRRSSGERPVLALTPLGHAVLDGSDAVEVEVEVVHDASRDRSRSAVKADLDATASERFERLRTWRRATAQEAAVPAYVVFDDRTLREVAVRNPSSADALASVTGVGPAKLARYGEAVLGVLAADPLHNGDAGRAGT